MCFKNAFLAFLAVLLIPLFSVSFAEDEPFTGPSNWGGTGLMEIPTARVMDEDRYRVGFTQVKPYRYYYGTVSPLSRLEFNLRITEVTGVPAFEPSSGTFRDKAFDLKYQFATEGKYMPALAIGFMDPHGTRIYPSQFITASKQIYPFDFTIGYGNGRFGDEPLPEKGEGIELEMVSDPGEWLRDSQFFGGLQFAPSDNFSLMLEYSPIKYHKQTRDPAQGKYFSEPVPSRFNIGLRYRPLKWSELGLSYQRGNKFGFHFTMAFDIGKPVIPIFDPPYEEPPSYKYNPLKERISTALYRSGFSDISVVEEGGVIFIEAQNDKYFFSTRAIGVILSTAERLLPENISDVRISLKENGIPLIRLSARREDVRDLYADRLSLDEFLSLSEIETDVRDSVAVTTAHREPLRYGLRPSFETFLNDRSGFFKYRLGLAGWVGYNPWKGATFITGLEGYPVNNISSTQEPLSIPVRSDIVSYKREKIAMGRMMIDQIYKMGNNVYGKVSAGYLEIQYAGIDAEIARPLFDGRLLVGLSGSMAKKRDPDGPFKLKNDDVKDLYTTAFINTRLNLPELHDIAVDVKAGRFLAGDYGARFTVSKFINGVILKAWYSVTDTSDFTDDFNKGYSDKGISVSIPIRLFAGSDFKSSYHFSLTPWTRDTGQDIDHFGTLFDFMGRNTKIFIDKDREMIYR